MKIRGGLLRNARYALLWNDIKIVNGATNLFLKTKSSPIFVIIFGTRPVEWNQLVA